MLRAKVRKYVSLSVYALGLLFDYVALLIWWSALTNAKRIFWACLIVLLVNGFSCALMARKEGRLQGVWMPCRFPVLIVKYGLCRWVQVEHILDTYKHRVADLDHGLGVDVRQHKNLFDKRTFDGITVGFPIAFLTLLAGFLTGSRTPTGCPWHMDVRSWHGIPYAAGYATITCALSLSGIASAVDVTFGAVAVDVRSNKDLASDVEDSSVKTLRLLLSRGSEVIFRITLLVSICILVRPQKAVDDMISQHAFLIGAPAVLAFGLWIFKSMILFFGDPHDQLCAHLCVAIASLAVNPAAYVTEDRHRTAAMIVNWSLRCMELCEVLLLIAVIAWTVARPAAFNGCGNAVQATVWDYFTMHDWYILAACLFFGAIHWATLPPLQKPGCTVIPLQPSGESEGSKDKFNRIALSTGLSSFLLQLGTGVSNHVFGTADAPSSDEYRLEERLGRGSYGEVAKARQASRGGRPIPGRRQPVCAIKFQAAAPFEGNNEFDKELKMLMLVEHEFAIKIERWFEVRQGDNWHFQSGERVGQGGGSSKPFTPRSALMMELCEFGDLYHYIKEHRPTWESSPGGREQRVESMRIIALELADVLKFLHQRDPPIAFRDLKPDNVFLRKGKDGQPVACLGDFGMARECTKDDPCKSPDKGTPYYIAPEVPLAGCHWDTLHSGEPYRIFDRQHAYGPAVDVYSFGATLLSMLGIPGVDDQALLGHLNQCHLDGSLPSETCADRPAAAALIKKCLDHDPRRRPEMKDVVANDFFGGLDLDKLRANAERASRAGGSSLTRAMSAPIV